jgi:site-specific DNA-methyltransferase (adenine-specific)
VSNTKGHPAPFPDEIPDRLIQLYTVEGETVLDPFGGSGTTMKVAKKLNRTSIVYEINSAYIELIKQNVGWNSTVDLDTGYEIKIRRQITN